MVEDERGDLKGEAGGECQWQDQGQGHSAAVFVVVVAAAVED